ncbi:LytR/AlgR family response regulator transcription factor [Chitinophaga polysaccharea]|uniref:LytR/AlgR family response regulator transcription factor n=1 Tax=Chitinophaga polysaccharea TaxID=1293035 RepID=UPI00115B7A14|nr:LytTR family DNA-binding domain-containing protein [Chitinophaga polysaccharea]
MKLGALIIDDDQSSADLLSSYIERHPELYLIGIETDARQARESLLSGKLKADIVFMDIEMPHFKGTELTSIISKEMAVVLVSGHRHYGPEAFLLNVADYRLKPLFYEDFVQAVEKAKLKWSELNRFKFSKLNPVIAVPENSKTMKRRIAIEDINYIMAASNYSNIYLEKEKIMTYITLAKFEEMLPMPHFVRTQKSYLVNVSKIDRYNSTTVFLINGDEIPVSKSYRDNFEKTMRFIDFRN